jgi:predicted Zn finger-like uncharacterized protein
MIAVCPKCSARYRVDPARLGPEGAKLRCSKCSALFLVRAPAKATAPTASATGSSGGASAFPVQASSGARATGRASETVGDSARRGSAPLVLVADADAARAKTSTDTIERGGLAVHTVHDGVEAMLAIQRMLPRVVVLDATLPRMNGFEICEIVKRNESLRSIHVVLIGGARSASRGPDDSSDAYGADDHLESPDLPDGLVTVLRPFGLVPHVAPPPRGLPSAPARSGPIAHAASAPKSVERPARPSAPTPIARASGEAAADPVREEERERARRLARIAVSEMLLYQPEKFAQACRDGTLERALELEIQEARALIRQRIGPEVRAEADFVLEELHRVARERGAKA